MRNKKHKLQPVLQKLHSTIVLYQKVSMINSFNYKKNNFQLFKVLYDLYDFMNITNFYLKIK
jgi:NADH:ubiquinone oxidoreductase subunit C